MRLQGPRRLGTPRASDVCTGEKHAFEVSDRQFSPDHPECPCRSTEPEWSPATARDRGRMPPELPPGASRRPHAADDLGKRPKKGWTRRAGLCWRAVRSHEAPAFGRYLRPSGAMKRHAPPSPAITYAAWSLIPGCGSTASSSRTRVERDDQYQRVRSRARGSPRRVLWWHPVPIGC